MARTAMARTATLLLLMSPLLAPAGEYPTTDKVRMVVACMAEFGAQNEENLLTCACRQDVFEAAMSFHDYEQASLFERYVRMPGKRGNLFRDSDEGRDRVKDLQAAREKAVASCPVVRKISNPVTAKSAASPN